MSRICIEILGKGQPNQHVECRVLRSKRATEDEEEKSDATSSDDGSSDSSIEAAINGDDETEESLYAKIQANNQEMETGEK